MAMKMIPALTSGMHFGVTYLPKYQMNIVNSCTFCEAVNGLLALLPSYGAINALVGVLAQVEGVLNDIQHDLELREYQYLHKQSLLCLPSRQKYHRPKDCV